MEYNITKKIQQMIEDDNIDFDKGDKNLIVIYSERDKEGHTSVTGLTFGNVQRLVNMLSVVIKQNKTVGHLMTKAVVNVFGDSFWDFIGLNSNEEDEDNE